MCHLTHCDAVKCIFCMLFHCTAVLLWRANMHMLDSRKMNQSYANHAGNRTNLD